MNLPISDFDRETKRCIRTYAEYEAQGLYKTVWSPFDEVEAAFRSQQWLAFSTLLREANLKDLEGSRILDVGCGTGRLLRSFLETGANPRDLHGIDINEGFIATARRLAPQLNFQTFNGWSIEFPNAHFDLLTQYVVFSSIALSELRVRLAEEMTRVLKPGGYIFWWDMAYMAAAAGGHGQALDVNSLFPSMRVKSMGIALRPAPSDCLSGVPPKISRLLRIILDRFGYARTHVAALIGPKP